MDMVGWVEPGLMIHRIHHYSLGILAMAMLGLVLLAFSPAGCCGDAHAEPHGDETCPQTHVCLCTCHSLILATPPQQTDTVESVQASPCRGEDESVPPSADLGQLTPPPEQFRFS